MTDYNDGKWHGWNGGECPVHPQTVVDAATRLVFLDASFAGKIGGWEEEHTNPIVAFRVVKEYREPREWWVNPELRSSKPLESYQNCDSHKRNGWILVREVLE